MCHGVNSNRQFVISLKVQYDDVAIDSAFKKIAGNKTNDSKVHFILAGYYCCNKIRSLIIVGMIKYKIKHVMMTFIDMNRQRLITKQKR